MLQSFIHADVYRIMLGCAHRATLVETVEQNGINHDGQVRVMCRDDGETVSVMVVFVEGEVLQNIALRKDLQLLQIDNISARLRAVPPLLGARKPAARSRGQAA